MNDKSTIGYLQPQSFPTDEDLAEPLDEQSKQELLSHKDDDEQWDDDNSARGYA